jgi:predicted nucleic acid-binding protein
MIVITDSNIIISALIKPSGAIAKIFKSKSQIQFFAPDFLLEELNNHLDIIEENSPLAAKKNGIKIEIDFLKSKIKFVPIDKIPKKYILEAFEIVKDIDVDDTFFVALNCYKHWKIWTCDAALLKGLKSKGLDICVSTSDVRKSLYLK